MHVASISEYDAIDDNTRASSITLPLVRALGIEALGPQPAVMDDNLDLPEDPTHTDPRGGYAAVGTPDGAANNKGRAIFRKGFPVPKKNIRLQISAMNMERGGLL